MTILISRRSMFIPVGGAQNSSASAAASGSAVVVTPAASLLSAPDRAVVAISASDNGFQAAIAASYPGLQLDPTFQQIAPLALLVTHQKGPAIRAHSVAWNITTPTGQYTGAQFYYIHPGSPAKGGSLNTLRSAPRAILRAGQSRLVTPFFSWTPAYYQRNPKPDWGAILNSGTGGFLASQLPAATQLNVSLDGVVFSDWKIAGPDQHNLNKRLRSRRNAEHDEALVAYRLLKADAPDSMVAETLEAHGSAARSSQQKHPAYWYQQARRYQAQILLQSFQNTDRTQFRKAIHRLVTQKKTVITSMGA